MELKVKDNTEVKFCFHLFSLGFLLSTKLWKDLKFQKQVSTGSATVSLLTHYNLQSKD